MCHTPCYNQSFFGISPVRLSVGKDKMKLRDTQVFLLRDMQFQDKKKPPIGGR
jgi:hypothetical protein